MTPVCARVPALNTVMEGDKLITCFESEAETLSSFAKRALFVASVGFKSEFTLQAGAISQSICPKSQHLSVHVE